MKKSSIFLLIALFGLSTLFSSCSKVPAGYVGVKVFLLGGDKGVNNKVLPVGRYWIGVNEELYTFPTYQVNYVFTRAIDEGSPNNEEFTFQTREGMECSMDMGLAMHFDPDKISDMFQTFHKGETEIRGVTVRNTLRDALNKTGGLMPIESVYGEGKSKLIDEVKAIAKANLDKSGIIIDNIYLIGSIRIPESVKNALDDKVSMTQKAQKTENELREANAQALIKIVQAKAEAEANRIVAASITPTLVQWKSIDKWNGILPTVTGGGAIPMINMK